MRAKPKPTRNTFTPELLVKQLAKDVPGFKAETPQVQAALASLVWIGATSLSLVPVNIEALKYLQRDLAKKIETMRRTGYAPRDLWMEYPSLGYLLDLHDKTAQIIRMAHTDVAGLGRVLHRYMESDSGRLYALGGASLQNAPAVIRQAALSARWDYDVENCHFAIAAQMAKRLDVAALEQAIQTATGYTLTLEEKLVQPDLAEQFGKAVEHEFSKVRKTRKASNDAGYSRIRHPINTVNTAGAS